MIKKHKYIFILLAFFLILGTVVLLIHLNTNNKHDEQNVDVKDEHVPYERTLGNTNFHMTLSDEWKIDVEESENDNYFTNNHIKIYDNTVTFFITTRSYHEVPDFKNITGGNPVHITWQKSEKLPELEEIGTFDNTKIYLKVFKRSGTVFSDYGTDRVTDEMNLWSDNKADRIMISFTIELSVPDERVPEKIQEAKSILLSLKYSGHGVNEKQEEQSFQSIPGTAVGITTNYDAEIKSETTQDNSLVQDQEIIIKDTNNSINIKTSIYKDPDLELKNTGGDPPRILLDKKVLANELQVFGKLYGRTLSIYTNERSGVIYEEHLHGQVTDEMQLWTKGKYDKITITYTINKNCFRRADPEHCRRDQENHSFSSHYEFRMKLI